jgi:hypothetical protein
MQSWQHWAILSLKKPAMATRRGARQGILHPVKLQQESSRQTVEKREAGGAWERIIDTTKLILIIGLGVAFGELLVRFVWSYLIWQWIQRHLP